MEYGLLHTSVFRLGVSLALGVAVAVGAVAVGHAPFAALAGWIVAAATFCFGTWLLVGRLDADQTRHFAMREDPGRAASDLALIVASLVAVGGVGALLAARSADPGGATAEAAVGVLAIASSWFTVHVMFMLRYARLYYGGDSERPIDFNEDADPTYGDFAYLAFTLGMTYQVSDTSLKSKELRRTALRHGLLSFLLGAIILASTINLVSQLASGGQ
jgi:uncharacterized membrane protein